MVSGPSPAARPVRTRVLDGAALLAAAGFTWLLPLLLPSGPAGWSPLAGAAGLLAVGALLEAGGRAGARPAAAALAGAGMLACTLAASGRFATADDPTNLMMALAPVFPLYAGHLFRRDRRRAWTMAALLTIIMTRPWTASLPAATDGLLYVCAPMLLGFYLAARDALVRTLTDRARVAERERDLRAEQARTQERTDLAMELHDVVTHRVTLMVLHAGALRVTTADQAVRDAAEHVRLIGCEAMAELRELIGVLRGGRPAPSEAAPSEAALSEAAPSGPVRPARAAAGRRPPRLDASDLYFALAACVFTVLLSVAVASSPKTGSGEWTFPWLEITLQLPVAAALAFRRRHPHLAAVPTLIGALVILWLSTTGTAALLVSSDATRLLVPAAAPLAAYAVAAHSRRPTLGAAVLLALLALAARPWEPYAAVVSVAGAFIGTPALLGLYAGASRRLVEALTERAERAMREQSLLAARARAEERALLAREIHGIVAGRVHAMLGWADRLGEASPSAESATAGAELLDAGRRALDELDDLVGAFPGAPDGSDVRDARDARDVRDAAERGAADLAELTAESASVGVPVDLVEEGDPATPSPAVARTAHRIVAEALTNVRKHAFGAHTRVEVRYRPRHVQVTVSNDRPPAGPHHGDPELASRGSGTGLLGVRRRVELVDGTLEAGPTGDGGFRIDAVLPAYVPDSSRTVGESGR